MIKNSIRRQLSGWASHLNTQAGTLKLLNKSPYLLHNLIILHPSFLNVLNLWTNPMSPPHYLPSVKIILLKASTIKTLKILVCSLCLLSRYN